MIMKTLALFLVMLSVGGCSLTPHIAQQVDSVGVPPTQATQGVTFNKLYAGSVATCGSLYTVIETLYRSDKITKAEAVALMGRVDGVRAALNEARVLHLTSSPRTGMALSSALNSLSIIREEVMIFKQRLAA